MQVIFSQITKQCMIDACKPSYYLYHTKNVHNRDGLMHNLRRQKHYMRMDSTKPNTSFVFLTKKSTTVSRKQPGTTGSKHNIKCCYCHVTFKYLTATYKTSNYPLFVFESLLALTIQKHTLSH